MRTWVAFFYFVACVFPFTLSFAVNDPDNFQILHLGVRDPQTGTVLADELHFTTALTFSHPIDDIEIVELEDGIKHISEFAFAGLIGNCSVFIGDYVNIEKTLSKLKTNSDGFPVVDMLPQYSLVDVQISVSRKYSGTRIYMVKRLSSDGPDKLILDCPGLRDPKTTIKDLKKEAGNKFIIHRLLVNKIKDKDFYFRN